MSNSITKTRFILIFILNLLIGVIATVILYLGKDFTNWLGQNIIVFGIITSIFVLIPVILLYKSEKGRARLKQDWSGFVPELIFSLLYGLAYAIPVAFFGKDQESFLILLFVLLVLFIPLALWLLFIYDDMK